MTTIDKLGLTGIRSYGTESETLIRFYRPLTIILGRNGSGKSTIIEAVKMATTGDLPPMVDKGAAFIHDPRIDNESETRAKIRLQFTNAKGDEFVVSRHFQLTIKKGLRGAKYKTEYKTLDQTLKSSTANGASARAFRGADLNALLPDIMRVTKPILNNVIFVHQEDSLWPLGDPKKLKEKFDDIFAATRYTKALESIRKFRKDQGADLRVLAVELKRFEEKVEILDQLRSETDNIRAEHDNLRRGEELISTEIEELRKRLEEATSIANEFKSKQEEYGQLQARYSALEENRAERLHSMQIELKDLSDAELREELEKQRERQMNSRSERENRRRTIVEIKAEIGTKERELVSRQAKRGRLIQQERDYKRRIEELESMKKDFFDQGLPGQGLNSSAPTDFDREGHLANIYGLRQSATLQEWTLGLSKLLIETEKAVEKRAKECRAAEEQASATLRTAEVRHKAAEDKLKKEIEIRSKKRRLLHEKRAELQEMGDVQAQFKESLEREAAARESFERKESMSKVAEFTKQRDEKKKLAVSGQEELDKAREVRDSLVQDQSARSRVEYCKSALSKKATEMETALESARTKLFRAIGEIESAEACMPGYQSPVGCVNTDSIQCADYKDASKRDANRQNLLRAFQTVISRKEAAIGHVDRNIADVQFKLSAAEGEQSQLRNHHQTAERKLRKLEAELGKARDDLFAVPTCEESPNVDELNEIFQSALVLSDAPAAAMSTEQIGKAGKIIESMDKKIEVANNRATMSDAYAVFHQQNLDDFESHPSHRCPTCGLTSAKKVDLMRARMEKLVEDAKDPSKINKEKDIVRKLQSSNIALKKVREIGVKVATAVEELQPISDLLTQANSNVSKYKVQLSEVKDVLDRIHIKFASDSAVEDLNTRSAEIARAFAEFEKSERDLDAAKDDIPSSTNADITMTEINSTIRSLERQGRTLQDDIDNISKSISIESEAINRASKRYIEATRRRSDMQAQANLYKSLIKERDELVAESDMLDKETDALQGEVQDLAAESQNAAIVKATVQAEQSRILQAESKKLADARGTMIKWKERYRDVEVYSHSGKDTELKTLEASISAIEQDVLGLKEKEDVLVKKNQSAEDSEAGIESALYNLVENQRYRENEQKMEVVKRSMRHVQSEIDGICQRAGGDPLEEVDSLNQKRQGRSDALNATKGKRQIYTEQYKQKKKELQIAEKAGSRQKFDECRIKKQTMELASSDLDRYHRALDQALMAFHTLKMNSINRIIKELWQQTYRGTDIDEIEITSDANEALGGSTAAGGAKRNYNYRVMMRQGQAQLDMRGRCSAGQKVLACLVIRLALAESFCTDCGILALDEPTTNLDQENISSLASALKSIIEHRRKQRNFQLVLITHDREFIEMIGARDFANDFFMVYKDQNGISHAKVQDLNQLPE